MNPRLLCYLRVNDMPPARRDDRARMLPIEIKPLTEWFEFCQKLSDQAFWNYELLTIDFNFKDDQSGPWFPLPGQEITDNDFLDDPYLRELKWSDRLISLGPNSGILIGVYLVAHAAHRDIPCGVAFHTRYAPIVMQDMSSAMLTTQIMLGSNAIQVGSNLKETMKQTISTIKDSYKDPLDGLLVAVKRFREEFKRRAGVEDEREVRLWMEPTSLWALLDLFRSVQTEEALDRALNDMGVEFYERNGALVSLDVRSMFIDCLMKREQYGVETILTRLPLSTVKPAGGAQTKAGPIWQFVEALATRTPSNIGPVLDFFNRTAKGGETRTINEVIKRKTHRLIALIFAWLDLYAERWFETEDRSWDPTSNETDGDFPPLTTQVKELVRLIASMKDSGWKIGDVQIDPFSQFIPLTGPSSISTFLREDLVPDSVLYRALRYGESRSRQMTQKSLTALQHLVATAVNWGMLEVRKDHNDADTYRIKSVELPARRPMRTLQNDLAARLGFNVDDGKDATRQLARIVQDAPGFEDVSVKDFLSSLEERPLPEHLKVLGWEFMDTFWRGKDGTRKLPRNAFPPCLLDEAAFSREAAPPGQISESDRIHEDFAKRQSIFVPPRVSFTIGDRLEVECFRHSAEKVGGDYYRIKPETNETCRLYIGDICGKGLSAGQTLQEVHGVITTLDDTRPDQRALAPHEILRQLDVRLGDRITSHGRVSDFEEPSDRWATFICGTIDLAANNMTFSNAGHPSAILVRQDLSYQLLESQSRGPGMIPGAEYLSKTVDLSRGDRLVLFTDGLAEQPEKYLIDCIVHNIQSTAKELLDALLKLIDFQAADDDLTLVVVAID
ncbi:MAG TPA: PP2C family protein-serine/threonine phosphatase [Pyrinomonadaceae bacterium]|nr:PP2C family protein-serine/threonine phosphatase [Pyrinomonadaceae bacterium]